jgi:hypothetical protein
MIGSFFFAYIYIYIYIYHRALPFNHELMKLVNEQSTIAS